ESFVGPRDHWLPPDHFQEAPRGTAAHRTSPTNIGLLLLSELAAYDLGYLTPGELASWVENTLDSVDRLETHRGHLLNWYETQTLAPLAPRYVSTVDSGNFAGALLSLAVGLQRLGENPVVSSSAAAGLRDTVALLEEALLHWIESSAHSKATTAVKHCTAAIALLDDTQATERVPIEALNRHFDRLESDILTGMHEHPAILNDTAVLTELRVWLERLTHQLEEFGREVSRDEHAKEEIGSRLNTLALRARAHAQRIDFRFLYDERRNLFHVGYNVNADRLDPHHYDLLASEARLASFLAVMSHQVPIEHWFSLGRPVANAGRLGHI